MAGNYLKAMQLTKQLQKQAVEASKNKDLAEVEIDTAHEKIKQAKEIDANTGKAEKALAEAENLFEGKEYKSALEMAEKARVEAEKAYKKRLSTMIESVENLNAMGEDMGQSSDDTMEIIKSAKESMNSGELEMAYELAKNAWEEAEKTIGELDI